MPYLGTSPADNYKNVAKQTITGTGASSYTLDYKVTSANELEVFVNNVRQEPGVAYTASSTSITFTTALEASDDCYIIFQGRATTSNLIESGNIADSAVTAAKLSDTYLTEVADSSITSAKIASGAIEGAITTPLSHRNLIINGAMQVWQRGTSATGLTATDFTTVDRFMANYGGGSSAGTRSVERSTDVPAGFNYSIKITHAGTSSTPNEYAIRTFLEMQDIKHLFGKTAVFSFYYKSNRTGTHAYRFSHNNIIGASSINGEFTVNSTDTWERKEIIITQLQNATGTLTADNLWGIHLDCGPIMYGEGLPSFDDGDYFAVTGVQLEVGSVATPFEHRSYGEELSLCKRYYKKNPALQGNFINATGNFIAGMGEAIQTMRATPSVTVLNGTGAVHVSNIANYDATGITDVHPDYLRCTMSSGPGGDTPGHFYTDRIAFDAEL